MEWIVEELPHLRGLTIEWAENGAFILSKQNRLYTARDLKGPFEPIAKIAASSWKSAVSRIRLGQRFLRFMVTNVVKLSNGDLFVTFDRSVGLIRGGKYKPLAGLVRPCRVLRSACATDTDGSIFFGEYLANNERGEMRIYRYVPANERVDVAYTFPAGSIKHVHGIYWDEYTDTLVCLTGDKDSECRMMRTGDGFSTVEVMGEGDESWRAVSMLFQKENFYYGTDAEFRSNQIYEVNRTSFTRNVIAEVSGTVFYSKNIGRDLFFATTAENSPSQKENVAALWHVDQAGECTELAQFSKDGWNGTLFMFGTIHFPYKNLVSDKLFFSLVGVKGDKGTFCVSRG